MKTLLVILLNIFLNSFCYSQSNDSTLTVNDIFNKANEQLRNNKSGQVNYVFNGKPFFSEKTFRTEVKLIFNKNIENEDSISGYMMMLNNGFIYMALNSNIYGIDSIIKKIEIHSIDTINNTSFAKLVSGKGMWLFKSFVSNKYNPLKVPIDYMYQNISLNHLNENDSYQIVYSTLDTLNPTFGYDSLIYHFSSKNYELLKYEWILFDSSEQAVQRMEFDSIVFMKNKMEDEVNIEARLEKYINNGYSVKQIDPYEVVDYISPIANKEAVPNWVVIDSSGKKIELKNIKSRLVLFDFSYMSCHYCIESLPMLNKLFNDYSRNDLTVCWIDPFDNDKKESLYKHFARKNVEFPVYYDLDKVEAKNYGITIYPYLFLVEIPSLKLLKSMAGYSKEHENELKSTIEKVLKD